MSPVGITLAFAVAFGLFLWLTWRKLSIVAALQPELRWDVPVERLWRVVINGFLQSRMLHGDFKPGLMHAVIFTRFMILLIRKVQLLVIGWHEPFVYPGAFGAGFAWLKDLVELAVLAAVAFGFWRRFWHPARRLEPNREAIVPSENFMFQIIRTFHLAGRCIACGECERVCPMNLPLMKLNRKLEKDAKELFDYESGKDPKSKQLLTTFRPEEPQGFIL